METNSSNKSGKTDRKNSEVTVSDHAVLRFLERVEGVDIEAIRKRIISEGRIKEAIKTLADGSFPSEDGTFTMRVKGKVVVTILKNE